MFPFPSKDNVDDLDDDKEDDHSTSAEEDNVNYEYEEDEQTEDSESQNDAQDTIWEAENKSIQGRFVSFNPF